MTTQDRAITLRDWEVRAVLNGATQIRRVVKPQPLACNEYAFLKDDLLEHAPYQPGQRLWVREKWRIGAWDIERECLAVDYPDGYCRKEWLQVPSNGRYGVFEQWDSRFALYLDQCLDDCDNANISANANGNFKWEPGQSPCRWRPSIFMPRWASRITLEVTGVRAEYQTEPSDDVPEVNVWVWVVEFRTTGGGR